MAEGVLTRESPHAFAATLARVEDAIANGGQAVFTRIDHRAAAAESGLEMEPATVLVFGNPRAGTPLMAADPLVALDLPLRVLVWERDGRVRVSCQEPDFVARRFGIPAEVPSHVVTVIDAAVSGE